METVPTSKLLNPELFLSRTAYRAGTSVVGSIRIRLADDHSPHQHFVDTASSSLEHDAKPIAKSSCAREAAIDNAKSTANQTPIRQNLTSARLYLTGRAQLRGSSSSSSWRSSKEIAKLKSLYGEHACLTFASLEERKNNARAESFGGTPNAAGDVDQGEKTRIERADKIALHLRLHSHESTFRSDLRVLKETMPQGEEDVICFWMTNVLELLDVKEQEIGGCEVCWNDETTHRDNGTTNNFPKKQENRYRIPRRPLKLPDYEVIRRVLHAKLGDADSNEEDDSQESSSDDYDSNSSVQESRSSLTYGDQVQNNATAPDAWEQIMASADVDPVNSTIRRTQQDQHFSLMQHQIVLTFRSSLPEDIPPTMTAECIKYFYSVVLVVTTVHGEVIASVVWAYIYDVAALLCLFSFVHRLFHVLLSCSSRIAPSMS
ncbi:hypothetical protein ACHAWX_006549 [Stephanocyclus meneghinianus]